MSSHRICTIGLFAWIAIVSASAQAATCYLIVDASDKTLYRSRIAPLSARRPGVGQRAEQDARSAATI